MQEQQRAQVTQELRERLRARDAQEILVRLDRSQMILVGLQ